MSDLKKGDRVRVYNRTLSGKLIVEGNAKLIKKMHDINPEAGETWLVLFDGEGEPKVVRNVYPKDKVGDEECDIGKLADLVYSYLKDYIRDREAVLYDLLTFSDTHGKDALDSMWRFIQKCRKEGRERMIIPILAHDLGGCEDKEMCPRTSGY